MMNWWWIKLKVIIQVIKFRPCGRDYWTLPSGEKLLVRLDDRSFNTFQLGRNLYTYCLPRGIFMDSVFTYKDNSGIETKITEDFTGTV